MDIVCVVCKNISEYILYTYIIYKNVFTCMHDVHCKLYMQNFLRLQCGNSINRSA